MGSVLGKLSRLAGWAIEVVFQQALIGKALLHVHLQTGSSCSKKLIGHS